MTGSDRKEEGGGGSRPEVDATRDDGDRDDAAIFFLDYEGATVPDDAAASTRGTPRT